MPIPDPLHRLPRSLFFSLKGGNTASMIFKSCMRLVVPNAVRTLYGWPGSFSLVPFQMSLWWEELSKPCTLVGIPSTSSVNCVAKCFRILDS